MVLAVPAFPVVTASGTALGFALGAAVCAHAAMQVKTTAHAVAKKEGRAMGNLEIQGVHLTTALREINLRMQARRRFRWAGENAQGSAQAFARFFPAKARGP